MANEHTHTHTHTHTHDIFSGTVQLMFLLMSGLDIRYETMRCKRHACKRGQAVPHTHKQKNPSPVSPTPSPYPNHWNLQGQEGNTEGNSKNCAQSQ